MTSEEKRAAVTAFVQRLSTGDFAGLPVAKDFSAWTAVNGHISRAQYESATKTVVALAPGGMVFEVVGTAVEGDRAAVEASCCAKLKTGAMYDQRYHFVFEFENNLIQRLRTYCDTKMVADVILPALSSRLPGVILKSETGKFRIRARF